MELAITLEITIVSAEQLRLGGRPLQKNAFVTVGTDQSNRKSTTVDRDGGCNPSWGQQLLLRLPPSAKSFDVQVHRKKAKGTSATEVGTAKVPVSDIMQSYIPAHHVHCLSYRLRDRDGGRNGIVNMVVRVLGLHGSWAQDKREVRPCNLYLQSNPIGASAPVIGVPVTFVK